MCSQGLEVFEYSNSIWMLIFQVPKGKTCPLCTLLTSKSRARPSLWKCQKAGELCPWSSSMSPSLWRPAGWGQMISQQGPLNSGLSWVHACPCQYCSLLGPRSSPSYPWLTSSSSDVNWSLIPHPTRPPPSLSVCLLLTVRRQTTLCPPPRGMGPPTSLKASVPDGLAFLFGPPAALIPRSLRAPAADTPTAAPPALPDAFWLHFLG